MGYSPYILTKTQNTINLDNKCKDINIIIQNIIDKINFIITLIKLNLSLKIIIK